MTLINRFEDLDCWKKARELVNKCFDLCESGKLSNDYSTKDQYKRAALSIMNNIAEGFGRYSDTESIRFFNIASSSAMETRSMTYILHDRKYISRQDYDKLMTLIADTTNLINGFIRHLKNKS